MEKLRKMTRDAAVVILAAGKGTRMKSDMPKVLHPIGNAPMLHHAMRAARALGPGRTAIVVGHGGEAVGRAARALEPGAAVVAQEQQLGTGHAVLAAREALDGFDGDLFVLFADTPFLRPETLAEMQAARDGADIVVLGFQARDPGRYGRLIQDAAGTLEAIVEAKDARPDQLAIRTCNSGLMAGDCATVLRLLGRVGNANAQGEYYLTDIVALARAEGLRASVVLCDEAETLGINDRVQLAEAEALFQAQARRRALLEGATLIAPETVWFSLDTRLGRDVTVHPHVVFGPGVSVGDGAEIRPFCHIEGAEVGPGALVGPFARLRPGARLAAQTHIGNFVEIKNSEIGQGAKVNHLSYIGDATLGAKVNIGAGTVTCNYDGFSKHRTEIGEGAFIGVNTALVAPVSVGPQAYVATGTVITRDVPADALAIARTPQQNREGVAPRLREKLRAKREKRD
jgi:bifunctional UDP-N-acetylglucosamine pyrophosphorylase / glucosamine-1-phosphate N-acetyltransferase